VATAPVVKQAMAELASGTNTLKGIPVVTVR